MIHLQSGHRSSGWRVLKWLAVLSLLSCGCCGGAVSLCLVAAGQAGGEWQAPGGRGAVVDLGDARYPPGTTSPVRAYTWRPSYGASEHRVRYLLATPEARQLARRFAAFAASAQIGCTNLQCAYDYLFRTNADAIAPLAERFADRVRAAGLEQDDAAALVITFVQEIPYEVPREQPFEVLPPALVVSQARGDCDSKAVLAVMLLRKLGISAVVLVSEAFKHAAVGVGLPGKGRAFTWRGRSYRYAEVTAPGWPIGEIDPRLDQPRLWEVMWIGPRADAPKVRAP